jgi:hypothetical protein
MKRPGKPALPRPLDEADGGVVVDILVRDEHPGQLLERLGQRLEICPQGSNDDIRLFGEKNRKRSRN